MNPGDRRAATWLVALFAVIVLGIAVQGVLRPHSSLFGAAGLDFRAFYCSGEAVAHGANPYLVEPLRACEHRVQWNAAWSKDLVIPSPLPAYDLAVLALLSHLPYTAAKAVWFVLLLGCTFIAAWLLTRLTRLPQALVLLCLLGGQGILCLLYGQLPPIVVAAIAGGAYLAHRGRFAWAAVALTCAMIEPHLGIAACLSAFVFLPRTRLAFVVSFAALAAAGVLAVGPHLAVGYFTEVLPAQAASELVAVDQYSLSHVVHVLGFSDRVALLAGTVSYLLLLALGILAAQRARVASGSAAFVPLLPAAFVLFAGSYIHEEQFMAAVPAALLAAAYARGARSAAAWLALALLSFSWYSFSVVRHASDVAFVLASVVAIAWLAALALPRRAVPAAIGASVAFVIAVAAVGALPGSAESVADPPFPQAVTAAATPAAANWAYYLRSIASLNVPTPRDSGAKLPSWIALLLLAIAVAGPLELERRS